MERSRSIQSSVVYVVAEIFDLDIHVNIFHFSLSIASEARFYLHSRDGGRQ